MLAVLRDAIWQFVGAILALVALFVTIWLYRKQKSKKILAYSIKEATPLVRIHRSFRGNLKIFLDEQEVKSISMSSLVISNRGNMPITRNDYDECLSIDLTENGQVLSCDFVDKNPPTLSINHRILDKSVELDPFLLNQNEGFTIRPVVVNGDIKMKIKARIVGGEVKSFEDIDNATFRRIFRVVEPDVFFTFLGIVIALVALTNFVFEASKKTISFFGVRIE